jgi:hypothetical protein
MCRFFKYLEDTKERVKNFLVSMDASYAHTRRRQKKEDLKMMQQEDENTPTSSVCYLGCRGDVSIG